MQQGERQSSFSRRSFLQLSTAVSTAVGLGIITEPMLAAGEAARYSREREAHNKYFSEGTWQTLEK